MSDVLNQSLAAFDTPAGRVMLGLALLALIGLVVATFWDTLSAPIKDLTNSDRFDTAKPTVTPPKLVSRAADDDPLPAPLSGVRNIVLGAVVLAFAVVLGLNATKIMSVGPSEAPSLTPRAALDLTPGIVPTTSKAVGQELADTLARHQHRSLCVPTGSLDERSVSVCEDSASVRLDILSLTYGDQVALKPIWEKNAASFVRAESHAAPFGFGDRAGFSAPETVRVGEVYDGYLVVGVAPADQPDLAAKRADSLRSFAINELSGGDRAMCLSEERVYAVSAAFDEATVEALNQRRTDVARLSAEAAATGKAYERRLYEEAAADLARLELLMNEAPAPILIGLKADPVSSDPDADMRRAADAFLASYGDVLQLSNIGPLTDVRACERGETVF